MSVFQHLQPLAALTAAASGRRGSQGCEQQPDQALIAKARAIHERVITLDTHDDINPNNFTAECNYTHAADNQVNLPKMVERRARRVFIIVYVGQGALTPEGTTTPTSRRSRSSTRCTG